MNIKTLVLFCIIVPTLITGCSSNEPKRERTTRTKSTVDCTTVDPSLADHIVRANKDGLVIDPTLTGFDRMSAETLPEDQANKNFEHLVCKAEALAKSKDSDIVKVLVHVHGGLNSFSTTDSRISTGVADDIMREERDWHYPIFISWSSGLASTWPEHIFRVREGKKTNVPLGVATSPFILLSDLLTTVGKYPSTVLYQVANEKDRLASAGLIFQSGSLSRSWKDSWTQFCDLDQETCLGQDAVLTRDNLTANLSIYNTGGWDSFKRGTGQLITSPVRYTVGSLWHSAIASSAWDNMKRRASNISYPTHLFDSRAEKGVEAGRLFEFLLDRAETLNANGSGLKYEITLIGHSMGTIVLNHSLVALKDRWTSNGALKNIVYMAAASTIDDAVAAIAPVLESTDYKRDFYNLTLNRVAEVSETYVWGMMPTGSLLISIDQHHDRPEHPLKRTFGSEVNILSSLDVIEDSFQNASGKLVFKAFDRYVDRLPQMHGDFNKIPFWKKTTWEIETN